MSQNCFREWSRSYHVDGQGENNVSLQSAYTYTELVKKIKSLKYKILVLMVGAMRREFFII